MTTTTTATMMAGDYRCQIISRRFAAAATEAIKIVDFNKKCQKITRTSHNVEQFTFAYVLWPLEDAYFYRSSH
jgi:hypothetical protein